MNAGTSLHARMFARLINLRYARRMQQNPKQIRKQSVIAQKSVARVRLATQATAKNHGNFARAKILIRGNMTAKKNNLTGHGKVILLLESMDHP